MLAESRVYSSRTIILVACNYKHFEDVNGFINIFMAPKNCLSRVLYSLTLYSLSNGHEMLVLIIERMILQRFKFKLAYGIFFPIGFQILKALKAC